jgi:hypothetical protein
LAFHVVIKFVDGSQFGLPFKEVAEIGIHSGKHGFMLENVEQFIVEVSEVE